jgi:hypothetical protein
MSLIPDRPVSDEVQTFISENAAFFARWYNGSVALDEIGWLEGRLSSGWALINARMPEVLRTIDSFLRVFPSLHGRSADDPVSSRVEFLVTWQLAPDVYLVSHIQYFDSSGGTTTSHPESTVVVRADDGSLKVQLVHE